MRDTPTSPVVVERAFPEPRVVAVNAAVIAFVDELLRLPSPASAASTVDLLYGRTFEDLPLVLAHVNGGIHIPLAALLASPRPLVTLRGDRLRLGAGRRGRGQALKGARAWARARYRELQAAFVTSTAAPAPPPAAALVRATYGVEGRHWLWQEVAARILHRVVGLNRAVLDLLAALARGEARLTLAVDGPPIVTREFDVPKAVLDLMAAALPPVAVPDWVRLAAALEGGGAALEDEEAVDRYRALLAEILGRLAVVSQPAVAEARA